MTLYAVLKLLHVASAIWLTSGLLGRAMALAAARRAPDIRILKAIADLGGRLENGMVAPGYLAVVVTGMALEEAAAGGAITERLRTYLDRGAMLRRYGPDIALVGVILVLMVLKPF